jgi:hypothetical protein
MSRSYSYLDDRLLNVASNRFEYFDSEEPHAICPLCGGLRRIWYVTVMNSDCDYLDTIESDKCDNKECGFEQFSLMVGE